MNRFDIEFWNGMNKAALKASKLVEKAKSVDEAKELHQEHDGKHEP